MKNYPAFVTTRVTNIPVNFEASRKYIGPRCLFPGGNVTKLLLNVTVLLLCYRNVDFVTILLPNTLYFACQPFGQNAPKPLERSLTALDPFSRHLPRGMAARRLETFMQVRTGKFEPYLG